MSEDCMPFDIQKEKIMPYIPFDIQMEIIKRLPVKPLIRFRSVSKPWKSFIDSSKFIKRYGARHTQPHSCIFLSYKDAFADEMKYICLVDDHHRDDNSETPFKVVPSIIISPQIKQYKITKVVGASHGLLCLNGSFRDRNLLVIWNPSIGKSFGIVVPFEFYSSYGFGVCPVTKDPTVVRLRYSPVEVFTLSSGVWNVIPSSNLPRQSIRLNTTTNVVIDRFIYWAALELTHNYDGKPTTNHMLVSFDLFTKKFRVLDLPDSLTNELCGPYDVYVCKLRESLVVYGDLRDREAGCCGVWVMEHDFSFRKLFTSQAHVYKILWFRNNSEPISDYGEPPTLNVYDPCSQQIKNLGIVGAKRSFFMDSYKESLLLLDHPDSQIYPDDNS